VAVYEIGVMYYVCEMGVRNNHETR